jgi:ABC-type transport system substrate-binding protein
VKYLVIVSLLVFAGCTKHKSKSNTISISLEQEIATLDPASCYDTVCWIPVAQVYESLYEFEYLKRPYSLRPLLAESMPTVSRDRLTYTFRLKKGIKYHVSEFLPKGREVKAIDIVNQIKRLGFKGSRSQGWFLFDDKVIGFNEWRETVGTDINKFFSVDVPGLRATDDQTLVIKLIHPYPQLLWAMALPFTSPIPEEAIRKAENDFSMKTVGTGPYTIVSYNPNQEVSLKKNVNYTSSVYPGEGDRYANENGLMKDAGAKLPFVENIKLKVIKESQTDWLNFMAKKTDMINLKKDHYDLALNPDGNLRSEVTKQNIQLQTSPTLIYWWINFNMRDPLFGKNLNLRKAIAYGVNTEKYIEIFTRSVAQKANSIYPPGIPGYSPSSELPYKYDLALAKKYLADAGYPGGKGLPKITYDVRGTDTRKRQMGEFVQQELRNLGIEIEVRVNTFPTFLEKSRKGDLQFWQGGWVLDYPDAENVLQLLASSNIGGSNSSLYSNPEYDKLFEELRLLEDGAQKFSIMGKMEKIVNADLPWIMQYYSRNYILYHDYVGNFRYSDIIYNNLKYLKIKKP